MSARIVLLKHEARRHYEAYLRIFDGMDCGHRMAQHISADAAQHARDFDSAMDELRAVDPAAPTRRLVVQS